MRFSIRSAAREDAAPLAELSAEFARYLRSLGDTTAFRFDAGAYLRDGFGPAPGFAGLVAESGAQLLGYLLYHPGYDADEAIRTVHVIDLYVRESARRLGVARALMDEAAAVCRRLGGARLVWAVYKPNRLAYAFYRALGARPIEDLDFMRLDVGDGKAR